MKNIRMLSNWLIHKYYVLICGWELGVPLIRLITHDLSKISQREWKYYAEYFYGNSKKYPINLIERAIESHYKSNRHHWQYWIRLPLPHELVVGEYILGNIDGKVVSGYISKIICRAGILKFQINSGHILESFEISAVVGIMDLVSIMEMVADGWAVCRAKGVPYQGFNPSAIVHPESAPMIHYFSGMVRDAEIRRRGKKAHSGVMPKDPRYTRP